MFQHHIGQTVTHRHRDPAQTAELIAIDRDLLRVRWHADNREIWLPAIDFRLATPSQNCDII